MSRTVMQQALEALESGDWYIDQLEMIVYYADDTGTHEERAKVQAAITALRAALAEHDRLAGIEAIEKDAGIHVSQQAEPQTTHWEGCEAVHPECKKENT